MNGSSYPCTLVCSRLCDYGRPFPDIHVHAHVHVHILLHTSTRLSLHRVIAIHALHIAGWLHFMLQQYDTCTHTMYMCMYMLIYTCGCLGNWQNSRFEKLQLMVVSICLLLYLCDVMPRGDSYIDHFLPISFLPTSEHFVECKLVHIAFSKGVCTCDCSSLGYHELHGMWLLPQKLLCPLFYSSLCAHVQYTLCMYTCTCPVHVHLLYGALNTQLQICTLTLCHAVYTISTCTLYRCPEHQ